MWKILANLVSSYPKLLLSRPAYFWSQIVFGLSYGVITNTDHAKFTCLPLSRPTKSQFSLWGNFHCGVVLSFQCGAVLSFHCGAVLGFHCGADISFHYGAVLSFHCGAVLSFHCGAVLSLHCGAAHRATRKSWKDLTLLLSRLKRFKTALQAYSRTNTELWTPPDGC